MKTLRLILGDQLNSNHSWYSEEQNSVSYVMMEMRQETDYVKHHIQKVVGFFKAMREFAGALREEGCEVEYMELGEMRNSGKLTTNLQNLLNEGDFERFEYQLPDEYRLREQLSSFCDELDLETEAFDTEHFLSTPEGFKKIFEGNKTYLMEKFYRQIRKDLDVLMDGDEPCGGEWNYDKSNRNKLPKDIEIPEPLVFGHEVSEITQLLEDEGVETMGKIDPENFDWPVNRTESLELLDFFVEHCLPQFGTFQDALTDRGWSLFHSRLSFSLNTKMLHPQEVVEAVEKRWRERPEEVELNQAEGFIRQIIGWREYMRNVYWLHMPDYAEMNQLGHQRKLPSWFWDGNTKMRCLKTSIDQSLEYAYAHHIQRLMVTGNFALLAGVDPDEVDAWYLGIYIDAIEWVEMPNTRGMSQYADGGIVGTKPYVSSANYLHKMGDHCKNCAYDHKKKTGEGACPFSSLYWHFHERHRDELENNPRIGMVYRTWDKMNKDKQADLLEYAEQLLENIDTL